MADPVALDNNDRIRDRVAPRPVDHGPIVDQQPARNWS
jgi:hypothetical protein